MKKVIAFTLTYIVISTVCAQDSITRFSNKSITTAIGVGFIEARPDGTGIFYEIGYQQSYWKNKLRFIPYILNGECTGLGYSHSPDSFFRNSTLGLKVGVDIVKYKAISICTQIGYGFNYTRGMIGTGGYNSKLYSSRFSEINHTITTSAGIRINPKNHRLAYEFHLINFGIGGNDFFTAQLRLGIDVKL